MTFDWGLFICDTSLIYLNLFWNWSLSSFLSWAPSSGLSRSWNHNRANRSCTRCHGATVPSNGSVSMCFLNEMGRYTTHNTRWNQRKARTGPQSSWNKTSENSHQNMIPEKRMQGDPWTSALPKRGDEWRGSLANAQARAHTRSHCEGADFRSRRRHRCLRFCIIQIIGQRSQLDSMRSQFLWDFLDMANAPRQVARAKENMENIIMELHLGAWHTELQRECTQGSLLPLGQSAKDFNKLQWYLRGIWMVNGAKLVFHPNIKLRHVVFSDQGGSWHTLKYIRAASVAQVPGV